jgi:hypothetical protein
MRIDIGLGTVRKDLSRQFNLKMILPIILIFLVSLTMLPIASALPGIELNTSTTESIYYSLPLLGTTNLEHAIFTAENSTGIDASIEVDFVRGTAHKKWWDSGFEYRTPIRFNLPSGYTSNQTIVLSVNLSQLISQGKLRSDMADLRLVENDVIIPISVENTDGALLAMFRTDNYTSIRNMELYYGSPSTTTMPNYESAYRFYENFNDINRWTIISGGYSFLGGVLSSSNGQNSTIMLTNYSGIYDNSSSINESVPMMIEYRLRLADNASSSIILSENYNFTNKTINLTLSGGANNYTICTLGGCVLQYANISADEWIDVKLNVGSNTINVVIPSANVDYTRYHNLDTFYTGFINENVVDIDYYRTMKKTSSIIPSIYEEQQLIQKISSATFGGNYGWTYDITGFSTDTYSIWTESTKNNYVGNSSLDVFSIQYNKIGIDIQEQGKVTKVGDKYVSDVSGTAMFTNPNNRNISINVLYDSSLQFIDLYENHFTGNAIVYNPLLASSSHTINYYITGISYVNPLQGSQSVLGTAISRANGLNNYYEFTQDSLTTAVKSVAPVEEKDSGKIIVSKSDTQFTLESLATTYAGLPFIITKTISKEKIIPGDIVEVSIKVNNVDVVSKIVTITDNIPDEFIHVERTNLPTGKRQLVWNFNMNKGSSRVVSYKMMYVGNSTGAKKLNPALVEFEIYNMTSKNITIFRDIPKSTEAYVQKNIKYLANNMARIEINVLNPGDKTIDELHVAEFIGGAMFKEESIKTPFKGEWILRDLNPGETWKVSYLTKNHELIENSPNVFSYEQDVEVDHQLFIDNEREREGGLWKESRSIFIPIGIILVLLTELLVAGYYVYRNVHYYIEDVENFNLKNFFMKKLKDFYDMLMDVPGIVGRISKNFMSLFRYIKHNVIMAFRIVQIWFASKLPIWWKIYDKLKVLNQYEWFLFIKMIIDYIKKSIKMGAEKSVEFAKPILEDVKSRAEKDIETRKKKQLGLDTEEKKEEIVMKPEDIIAEKEALEKYKKSQEMLNNLMNDFKK